MRKTKGCLFFCLKNLSIMFVFLFLIRNIAFKQLAFSDFTPFSGDFRVSLTKFFYLWKEYFAGSYGLDSMYFVRSVFELLAFNNACIAQDICLIVFFLFGYYGMYTLLKRMKAHPIIGYVVPFFFIINPVMAAEISNGALGVFLIYSTIPWFFLLFYELINDYRAQYGIYFSFVIAIFLLNIQTAFWILMSVPLLLLINFVVNGADKKSGKALFFIGINFFIGILLNVVSLLTFFNFSKGYSNISYLETFRATYQKVDYDNLFRLVGNSGSSQSLLGYFDASIYNSIMFAVFGLIIVYIISAKTVKNNMQKTLALFSFACILFSMFFMNLIKDGWFDEMIINKNLLIVSARNPQKIFYLYAFCYVLLFGLALDKLYDFLRRKINAKIALIAVLVFIGIFLGQNRHFFSGDFALSQTRGENNYFIEDKYYILFEKLENIDKGSKVLYLPFDYELQLKTFWGKGIVKYRMGGNMTDSEKNSDILKEVYSDICAGDNSLKFLRDKLNVNYVVLDKNPNTYIQHDKSVDCMIESKYDTPYIWGRYEYFDRIFSSAEVYYEDDNFKVLKINDSERQDVFAIDNAIAINNSDEIDQKYEFITKDLNRAFNFVVSDKEDNYQFTLVKELFYGRSDMNDVIDMSPINLNSKIYYNVGKKYLYYEIGDNRLVVYAQIDNGLYINEVGVLSDRSNKEVILNESIDSSLDYYMEFGSSLLKLERNIGAKKIGQIDAIGTVKIYFVANMQQAVSGIEFAKTNSGNVYDYNDKLWRASILDNKVLQKSEDGGKSWVNLHAFEDNIAKIIVTQDNSILVSQDPGGYWDDPPAVIYRSVDGGYNFEKSLVLSSGGLATWSFDVKGNDIVIGEYGSYGSGSIYLSNNSGLSWKKIFTLPSETIERSHIHKVLFDPYVDGVIYASNGDEIPNAGLWYTRDSGNTWKKIADGLQPTWLEANSDHLFLFGDLTGQISRIRKNDLFNGAYNIEVVYDATRDTRASFGKLSYYGGRIDSNGNIFAAGVAYGEQNKEGNNKNAGIFVSSDNGNSWNILKVYQGLPNVSSGVSYLSNETKDGRIFAWANNSINEIIYLNNFKKYDADSNSFLHSNYDNLIINSDFKDGLWNKKVGDCSAYDDSPVMDMRAVLKDDQEDEYLQLETSRHIACATNIFPVEENTSYVFGFDYQSPNAKKAGYYIQFNDDNKTIISEKMSVDNDAWNTYKKIITVPQGAKTARLFIYSYAADGDISVINNYDNFELYKIFDQRTISIDEKYRFDNIDITLRNDQNIAKYNDSSYEYQNIFLNGSFENGLWQDVVEDCKNYDDNPSIKMLLSTVASDGEKSIELEAKKHTACTSKTFAIKGSVNYHFSFDYQGSNAKKAGYYIKFNDEDNTTFRSVMNISDKEWHTLETDIKSPQGATFVTFYIYSYESDGAASNVVRYDNFKLIELNDLENKYYFVRESDSGGLEMPDGVEYYYVNPTKRIVKIRNATKSFFLVLGESYHEGWQLEFNNEKVSGFWNGWVPFIKSDKIEDDDHFKLNDFLNAWFVEPEELCANNSACTKNPDGSYDMEMVIEFFPQRWFYLGLLVSGTTLAGCIGYLGYDWRKRRRKKKIQY